MSRSSGSRSPRGATARTAFSGASSGPVPRTRGHEQADAHSHEQRQQDQQSVGAGGHRCRPPPAIIPSRRPLGNACPRTTGRIRGDGSLTGARSRRRRRRGGGPRPPRRLPPPGGPAGRGRQGGGGHRGRAADPLRSSRRLSGLELPRRGDRAAPGAAGAPCWLVDPNDGTRDYLVGRRGSAVSIGLLVDRRPVLGVVFAFAYPDDDGDFFAWAEGCGPLRRNGREVAAALPDALGPLDVVLVSSGGDRDPETNLRCAAPARYRALPSIAHRLALVAAGEAAAATSLFAPCAWDYGAGQALLRASGAVAARRAGPGGRLRRDRHEPDRPARSVRGPRSRSQLAVAPLGRRPQARDAGSRRARAPGARPRRRRQPAPVARAGLLLRAGRGRQPGQPASSSRRRPRSASAHPGGLRTLVDGGRWQTLAGQPTDDSEMALALARSIVAEDGYEPGAAYAAYREWYRSQPFDVGNTTRAALNGYLMGESQANGSLMRARPLGVLAHAATAEQAAATGRARTARSPIRTRCAATPWPRSWWRWRTRSRTATPATPGARRWPGPAARRAQAPVVEALRGRRARAARAADGENQGWVLVALQNAFHDLLHAPGVEEGIVASVARGGDTDTNAAIAGALLGAVHGREAVPAAWRSLVLSCRAHPLRARHAASARLLADRPLRAQRARAARGRRVRGALRRGRGGRRCAGDRRSRTFVLLPGRRLREPALPAVALAQPVPRVAPAARRCPGRAARSRTRSAAWCALPGAARARSPRPPRGRPSTGPSPCPGTPARARRRAPLGLEGARGRPRPSPRRAAERGRGVVRPPPSPRRASSS